MRGKALAEGIPKEQVTSRLLTSALLELASEDGSPFVVVLMDKGSAVLKSRGICQRCGSRTGVLNRRGRYGSIVLVAQVLL